MEKHERRYSNTARLIKNTSNEITKIGRIVSEVEMSLVLWLRESRSEVELPSSIQNIDLVIQSLDDLAPFLARLADMVDQDQNFNLIDATSEIKLASLREGLRRNTVSFTATGEQSISADIELF